MRKVIVTICLICCFVLTKAEAVLFNDGLVHTIDYSIVDERVFVCNNFWDEPTTVNVVAGGNISRCFEVHDDSFLNVLDGRLATVEFYSNSQGDISGGVIGLGGLRTRRNSQADISGGAIEGVIRLVDFSVITFYGSDFMIDGRPVNGTITGWGGVMYGTLTGTFVDGSAFNSRLEIHDYASLTLIPEPATLLLLGLGAVMLRKRK